MGGLILVGLVVGAIVLYLWTIERSRAQMDRLQQGPDDLRRADDNQQPPMDGSAGLV